MKDCQKGYIFDFGGTLDTDGQHWARRFWLAYERAGVPVDDSQFYEAYVETERTLERERLIMPTTTLQETLRLKVSLHRQHLEHACGVSLSDEQVDQVLRAVAIPQPLPCLKTLSRLKAEGYTLALVSNYYGNLLTVIRELGIDHLFSTIVDSTTVGIRKPNPEIFRLALDRMGMEPEQVTVVGDSMKNDILPARSLGCRALWLSEK